MIEMSFLGCSFTLTDKQHFETFFISNIVFYLCIYSHVSNTAENGEGGAKTISSHNPSTSDRYTQTEPQIPNHETVPLVLTQAVQSLSLEDALPQSVPFTEETPIELHREAEDAKEVERGKDQTWSSIVEDAIQPTTIRTLQKQQSKGSEDSQGSCPQTPTSSSPAPPKEPTSSLHGGPLALIREAEKILCVDRLKWNQALAGCLNSLLLVLVLILTLLLMLLHKPKLQPCWASFGSQIELYLHRSVSG